MVLGRLAGCRRFWWLRRRAPACGYVRLIYYLRKTRHFIQRFVVIILVYIYMPLLSNPFCGPGKKTGGSTWYSERLNRLASSFTTRFVLL